MAKVTEKLLEEYGGKLPSYVWPGGYPVYYITPKGEILCPICANDEENLLELEYEINWEDEDLYCEGGCKIPSAYGEEE
jgi:hypothetical protein